MRVSVARCAAQVERRHRSRCTSARSRWSPGSSARAWCWSDAGGARGGCWCCSGWSRLLAASQLAVALVNRLATLLATPQPLPRMDFSKRDSAAIAHPGRGPDDADRCRRHRGPGRGARSPLPRQPGREPALRAAHRFPRRGRGDAARETRRWRSPRATDRGAQPQVPQRGALLPVPPPAPLESRRARLDGLRAQARQARRPECLLRGAPDRSLRARRRRNRVAARREVRDHARHRHAAAARCGAPARRARWRTR